MLGLSALGRIEPGRPADLALFDVTGPRWLGSHDRLAGPVISGGQAQLRASFVAGRPIVTQGRLDWLDLDQLAADAERVTARLRRAA
ncbi:hypothetical protein [Aureimonas populi]|uniref:Amidohydrolase-related domain-containing protein n=1 Tax=Aureimonas populi TaxID=1701758 RepID=A0ABW5CMJ5_9HYPH|nr:hypothetical protein [Aureimonas populi]